MTTTPLMQPKALFGLAKPKVDLVIDVSNLAYRAYHKFKDLTWRDQVTGHIYGAFSMLMAFKRHHGAGKDSRLVFAIDDYCHWRRELHPEYKATRRKSVGSLDVVGDLKAALEHVPGVIIEAPGNEADDAIAAHVTQVTDRRHVVLSMDKDLWQLVDVPNTQVLISTQASPITQYDIRDEFHTTRAELVPVAKACFGDKSDNLPGIKNFPKVDFAMAARRAASSKPNDFMAAIEELKAEGQLKPRTAALLRDNFEQFRRIRKIARLQTKCEYVVRQTKPDRAALRTYLADRAINSIVERLDELFGSAK